MHTSNVLHKMLPYSILALFMQQLVIFLINAVQDFEQLFAFLIEREVDKMKIVIGAKLKNFTVAIEEAPVFLLCQHRLDSYIIQYKLTPKSLQTNIVSHNVVAKKSVQNFREPLSKQGPVNDP